MANQFRNSNTQHAALKQEFNKTLKTNLLELVVAAPGPISLQLIQAVLSISDRDELIEVLKS